MLAALDTSLGAPRFAPLAKTWLDRAAFPDLTPLLRELGVSPGAGKEANFTPAPSAALRDAIMARAPGPLKPAANRDPE